MMRKLVVAAMVLCWVFCCPAKSGSPVDPVAATFADWRGVEEENYLMGRRIAPSDLRHKVTVVVVLNSREKLREQLLLAEKIMPLRVVGVGKSDVFNWKFPRHGITVFSCRGDVTYDALREALHGGKKDKKKSGKALKHLAQRGCCYYRDVTFVGAPDPEGKSPYVYVMGSSGVNPLWHGQLTDKTVKEVGKTVSRAKKEVVAMGWRPFYGTIAEPKYHPQLAKALEKGKRAKSCPLDPVAKDILAGVTSQDAEKAREAQILYDAINQTRDDLIDKIAVEAGEHPHVAAVDIEELQKYWPQSRERVEGVVKKLAEIPEVTALADAYATVRTWSDVDLKGVSAGTASKAVAELTKAQKSIAKLKDSKKITVQNAAYGIAAKIEALIQRGQTP